MKEPLKRHSLAAFVAPLCGVLAGLLLPDDAPLWLLALVFVGVSFLALFVLHAVEG